MLRIMLKGLLAHKGRLVATTLAIVLGVMFYTVSLVFADTVQAAEQEQLNRGGLPDVVVQPKTDFADTSTPPARDVPGSVLAAVRAVPGVRAAEGLVNGAAQVLRPDGRPVDPDSAAGTNVPAEPRLSPNTVLGTGRAPRGPQEAVVDQRTADELGLRPGAAVTVLVQGRPRPFTLVGTLRPREGATAAMKRRVGFDLATAQQLFGRGDAVDVVGVVAAPGTDVEDLARRVSAAAGPAYQVDSGDGLRRKVQTEVDEAMRVFRTVMSVFAGVTLAVGAFIVATTFAMILAQRTRELALLRCVGADRRQLTGAVLAEGVLVGAVAGAIGVGAGIGVAAVLVRLADDGSLPLDGVHVTAGAVVRGLLAGVGMTVSAMIATAVRATRVSPLAALRRDAVAEGRGVRRLRTGAGLVLGAGGAAAVGVGLTTGRVAVAGFGVLAAFVGVVLLLPVLVRPLAWAFGRLLRGTGVVGHLAAQNVTRNPRRTGATVAALMVGLGLIVGVGTLAESIRAEQGRDLREQVSAEVFLSGRNAPLPAELLDAVGRLPETGTLARTGTGTMQIGGETLQYDAVDPAAYGRALRVSTSSGSIADLRRGGIAVRAADAAEHGWVVGRPVQVAVPGLGLQNLPVRAVVTDNPWGRSYLVSWAEHRRLGGSTEVSEALLVPAGPAGAAGARAAVERAAARFPDTVVQDKRQLIAEQGKALDQLVTFLTGLLGLSVVIALIGVVNTLALAVVERTRELGVLRAVGMQRRQVRGMVRAESVVVTLLGTLLGALTGVGAAAVLVRVGQTDGASPAVFAVPVALLVTAVVGAAVVGVLAAVLPARRAARVDLLRAVTADG